MELNLQDKPEAQDKGADSVRAVHRALDVLLAFSREDAELTASALLQKVKLSRPTLYRLLHTLETKGFIASSGNPQRFRLGPAVARLSYVWTATLDIAALAEPVMRDLWQHTHETVAVFVAQEDRRLCVAELPSPQPLSFKRGVGHSERIALGATGRAILAFKDPSVEQLQAYTEGLPIHVQELEAALARTREHGYAVSRDELIQGAVAVAAPFFNNHGVIGSIGVFGPATRLDEAKVAALGPYVIAQAQRLSRTLGVPQRIGEAGMPT